MKTRRKVYFPEDNTAASVKDLEAEKQSRLTWEGSHNNLVNGTADHSLAQKGSEANAKGIYSAVFGEGTRAAYRDQYVIGTFNDNKSDNLFEIGNGGKASSPSNAFEVLKDGRAKVYTAPAEVNDVARKLELDGKISISDINQAFFNSLY